MKKARFAKQLDNKEHSRKLLLSSLSSYAIVLLIPFLLSVFLYVVSIYQSRNYAIELNSSVLESASESVTLHLQEVSNISTEIINKTAVQKFQNEANGFTYPHSYKLNEIRDALDNYTLTQTFIDDYFIFFNTSRMVINSRIIYTYDDYFMNYMHLPQEEAEAAIQRTLNMSYDQGITSAQEMTLSRENGRYLVWRQSLIGLRKGYLTVLINEESINSLFSNINIGDTGAVFVLNSSCELMTCVSGTNADIDELYSAVAINDSDSTETVFSIETAKGEMLINCLHTRENGLTYISAQPMHIILERVSIYRTVMIICLVAVFIVGLLLCLRQARHFTGAVEQILHEIGIDSDSSSEAFKSIRDMIGMLQRNNEQLLQIASQHRSMLRTSFASRLLRGNFSSDAEAMRIFQYVMPECSSYQTACVLLMRLTASDDMLSDEENMQLLTSLKVVLKDYLTREMDKHKLLYYDVDEESLALIVFDMPREIIDMKYADMRSQMPEKLLESLQAFGGGEVTPPLTHIARSFEQARTAMLLYEHESTLQPDGIAWLRETGGGVQYFYPTDMRYRLTEAIKHGEKANVRELLGELIQSNFYDHPVSHSLRGLFVADLLSTAVGSLQALKIEGLLTDDVILERIETISRASWHHQPEMIKNFFDELTDCAEKTRSGANSDLMQRVQKYIDEHYRASDLSLASIADCFSISVPFLSNTFKLQTQMNLSTYIEDLRMKEARRLLRTSDWTINKIASEVGYLSANTFCRAFRRNTGYNTSTYKAMAEQEQTNLPPV